MIGGVYALRGAVEVGAFGVQYAVVHAAYVQQPRLDCDVLELALPVAAQHPAGGGEYPAVGRFAASKRGTRPIEILIAIVFVVEERCAKAEIVGC